MAQHGDRSPGNARGSEYTTSRLYRAVLLLALFTLLVGFGVARYAVLLFQCNAPQGVSTTQQQQQEDWSSLRIAIFLTTHLSKQHVDALERCWPPMVHKSQMLQHSDVFLYTAKEPNATLIDRVFHQTGGVVRTELYHNPGKQRGAMLPVEEAIRNADDWFDGYDWIVRVNPDVLILNDATFFPLMVDPKVDAILVNCFNETDIKLHTDFFAVRPRALPKQVVKEKRPNAERHFTAQMNHVLTSKRFAWLPGVGQTRPKMCRVFGETIVHKHVWLPNCTNLF